MTPARERDGACTCRCVHAKDCASDAFAGMVKRLLLHISLAAVALGVAPAAFASGGH
jgi:hypothetical protein